MPKAEENESGGGKIIIVILALAVVGLGFAFYKRGSAATEAAGAAAKSFESLSNQVDQLRTKLALETSTASFTHSNLTVAIERRTAALLSASNRLIQVHLLYSNAQHQVQQAQADLQAQAGAVATLEAERAEFQRQAVVVPKLESELARTGENLTEALMQQGELKKSVTALQVSKAELEKRLADPAFLKLHARQVEEEAAVRAQYATQGRISPRDTRARLELQPDGTVRLGPIPDKTPPP